MKKFIIILGCNIKQLPYLQKLKKNYFTILIDKNKNAPGLKFADMTFQCSYSDIEGLKKIYNKIKKYRIRKIFTGSSHYAQIGASFIAKKFKIIYPPKKNIDICINKALHYPFFIKNELKIPRTHYLKNKLELKKILSTKNVKKIYFLKSDFCKSPNYIYKGTPKELLKIKINWKKDQFFKEKYILQEKFFGKNLRVNIYRNKYEIYDFYSGDKVEIKKYSQLIKLDIIKKLKKLCKKLKMYKWLLKFDLILSKNNYVLLDIGMDPPHRMRTYWEKNDKNFINFYLNLYLK